MPTLQPEAQVGKAVGDDAVLQNREHLAAGIDRARDALLGQQNADGYWCFELEADCTIPAEYILMMHFMDEIDAELQQDIVHYLRKRQLPEGGWPLYNGGDVDVSCSVKSYYALKLAGNDPADIHMQRARDAILRRGGAARVNVFTRICLAIFQQIPWRAVPFIPVEIVLLPKWFFFHLSKVSYWSRTVMVPLLILVSLRVRARNPQHVAIRELFCADPEIENYPVTVRSWIGRLYLWLDKVGHILEPAIPQRLRAKAINTAEQWFTERLNGEDGLGAIFPAMVNAYEALDQLGYAEDHPFRIQARDALRKLLIRRQHESYCQPCVSPVWDTALACHALLETGGTETRKEIGRALDWLVERQICGSGDWQQQRPDAAPGGWAFQFRNDCYPDVDDTAAVAWAMQRYAPQRYHQAIERGTNWSRALQSKNGGFGSFDADNTHLHLNEIPFADHKALLDPPTADVSARVATLLAQLPTHENRESLQRVLAYLAREQEDNGAWFGRWGTNYVYGTWSVLTALHTAGVPQDSSMVRKAATWLKEMQQPDGGWGESNDGYLESSPNANHCRATNQGGTSYQTAWAIMGLIAAGEANSSAVSAGVEYLLRQQHSDGSWSDPWFNAPGFPRIFYLKYHGYSSYFPLWALAKYRNAVTAVADATSSR